MAEFLEKDLQDFLWEKTELTPEENYFEEQIYFDEKEFSLENHGRIDLIGHSENFIYILELKRHIIDANALVQILKYKTAFETFVKPDKKVRCILIAPEIDNNTHNAILGMQDTICYIKNKVSFSLTSSKYHLVMEEENQKKLKENVNDLLEIAEVFSDEIHLSFYENFKENRNIYETVSKLFSIFVKKLVVLSKKISNTEYEKLINNFNDTLLIDFDYIKENFTKDEDIIEQFKKSFDSCEESIIECLLSDEE